MAPIPLPAALPTLFTSLTTTSSSSPNVRLAARQSADTGCNCPNSLSGGAIAGIVIGSIAGTLLLIWLWRSCMTQRTIHEAEKTGAPIYTAPPMGYPTSETVTHKRRRRRSPVYGDGDYVRRSRSGGGSVRRPRRVYVA
ncbi:hypothetical protein BDW74DRAFT_69501 [Aspergillus multicolor]|uniref:uncharacterized protein n=1 Tax=Aspergillus multicolor TaxID=41759 RepID=UPI003CCDF27F